MEGWQTKTLGEAFRVVNGGTPKTGIPEYWDGAHHWITPAEMGGLSSPFISGSRRTLTEEGLRVGAELVPANSIILSTRAPIGHLVINEVPMAFNQGCKGLVPSSSVDAKFGYYFLLANVPLLDSLGTGATFKELSSGKLKEVRFRFPVLAEQRRIVAILDEAFEGIATAKANAEKNLNNARELFDSHLEAVLAQGGDGWVEAPILECFKVRSGDFLPARSMASEGDVPVYGGNGIAGSHDVSNLSGNQIVIGRVGAKCGNVRHVSGEIWLTDNAFHVSKYLRPFDPAFLARVLNLKNLRHTANQAAQPVISYTTIKDVLLSFPVDPEVQRGIAARLDELEEHVENVKAVFERKLTALDELKKSLLHQAFSGHFSSGR